MYPAYLKAHSSGLLKEVTEQAFKMLESCSICPRGCKVNRLQNEKGFCATGLKPRVCNFMAHRGEEPPISGKNLSLIHI